MHASLVLLAGESPAVGNILPGIVDVRLGPREIVILDRVLGNMCVNEPQPNLVNTVPGHPR